MKERVIILILFLCAGTVWAQEKRFAGIPSDNVIRNYMTEAKTYAALYSGKAETPYEKRYVNHPYFETNTYIPGTLCYNRVVYKDVLMRFDLFRNELTVYLPGRSYNIVLNNEKFNYAVLNGSTIVLSDSKKKSEEKFLVLLQNGIYPVVRKYNIKTTEDLSDRTIIKYLFRIQKQYAIYINGIPCDVKNKNAILKLFPDRRKELNEFAKQQKLNFKDQIEQSIIDLVNHYENLTNP